MNTPETPGPVHYPLQTEHTVQGSNCEICSNWGQRSENPPLCYGCVCYLWYI